jgi:hypothetical protein
MLQYPITFNIAKNCIMELDEDCAAAGFFISLQITHGNKRYHEIFMSHIENRLIDFMNDMSPVKILCVDLFGD